MIKVGSMIPNANVCPSIFACPVKTASLRPLFFFALAIFLIIINDGNYGIYSTDTDPESFFKLLFNLIIQETYKETFDQGYISPRVILDVLHKNIDSKNDFAKEYYDYGKLTTVEINLDKKPNLLLGHRIKNEAIQLQRKLNQATSLGLEGNYLIFLNADDQIYTLKDNEDRDLVLVFLYFMDGCKKYKLNPYRILRALRQRFFNLRQKMLLVTFKMSFINL